MMIKNWFKNLIKSASSSQMLLYWFLGGLLAIQVFFDFLYLNAPLKFIIGGLLILMYLILIPPLVKLTGRYLESETERKQISAMLLSINDAVVAYTKDFEVIMFNLAAERLCNIGRQEVVGKRITPELSNDPKLGFLAKIIFPSLAPSVNNKSVDDFSQKVEIKFFEPRDITLEVTSTKVFDDRGRHFGFLKIIKDRSREEALVKTQSDFITVAAHQLRTPLAGLLWALEILSKKDLGSLNIDQEGILTQAHGAAKEMSKSVESLLSISQMEEGKFGYKFESSDLEAVIESVLVEYEPAAREKGVSLYFYRLEKKLPSFIMDANRIKVVIETLVDNAIKYNNPKGEVKIKLELITNQPFIKISVEDTGPGIAPKDLDRLFNKFFRSERVMKEQTSGLGLGLYIARNIIRRHGGDIKATSVLKRGTIFELTLPLDSAYIPPQDKESTGII